MEYITQTDIKIIEEGNFVQLQIPTVVYSLGWRCRFINKGSLVTAELIFHIHINYLLRNSSSWGWAPWREQQGLHHLFYSRKSLRWRLWEHRSPVPAV